MVLQMRGTITPAQPWDVMVWELKYLGFPTAMSFLDFPVLFPTVWCVQVDLFFYREPEEAKEREDEEGVAPEYTPAEYNAPPLTLAADPQWGAEAVVDATAQWDPEAVAPTAAPAGIAPEWAPQSGQYPIS